MHAEQFNFRARWDIVVPHLHDEQVQGTLWYMRHFGTPHPDVQGETTSTADCRLPMYYGERPLHGWNTHLTLDDLDAYRPLGRCHDVVGFACAIGERLFPSLTWGLVGGDYHSVAVGCVDMPDVPTDKHYFWPEDGDILVPSIVMDILLFERCSAANSLAYALANQAKHAPSLRHYVWHECFADLPPHNPAVFKSVDEEIDRFLCSGAFFSARPKEVTDAVLTAWANHEFEAEIVVDT